jgi:hydroxymethylpyrimidine pyrophosphatase-like HAD family hydrolase
VEFLRGLWKIPKENVLAGGDSGNDLDMLENYLGVSVANARLELRQAAREEDNLHQSILPYAAGILEGAEEHEFWENGSKGESD